MVFIGLLALTQHDLLDTWAELCSVTLLLPAGLPSIYTYTHTHTLRHTHTHTHMIMFTLTIKDADTYFTWSSEYRQTGVHSHTQKLNGHAHTFNHKIPCNASNAHTTGTHTHTLQHLYSNSTHTHSNTFILILYTHTHTHTRANPSKVYTQTQTCIYKLGRTTLYVDTYSRTSFAKSTQRAPCPLILTLLTAYWFSYDPTVTLALLYTP